MKSENNEIEALRAVMIQNDLFQRYHMNGFGVFGSVARGEVSNDIDILIEENIDYHTLAAFRSVLEQLMNKRIDIMMAKYANPIVLFRAKKELIHVGRN